MRGLQAVVVVLACVCFKASNAFCLPIAKGVTACGSRRALTPTVLQSQTNNKESSNQQQQSSSSSSPQQLQAQELLEKARKLREEIDQASSATTTPGASREPTIITKVPASSPWALVNYNNSDNDDSSSSETTTAYRFYVDIGREQGTWMDQRWGASGQRIAFSLDVAFTTRPANRTVAHQMVQDNQRGSFSKKSPVYCLDVAPFARLRGGFDRMKCQPGAYRLDIANNRGQPQKTLRLFFFTEGKTQGDVSVPKDSNLYISLPVLADSSLSRKEGIVSVRQFGWHTGLYRQESRIVGVVRALPLKEARAKDGF